MNDLIKRQVAIDAAVEAADEWDGCHIRSREEIITMKLRMLPSAQPDVTDVNVGGINKLIDGLVEIFADIREKYVDDSVCGLCEFDGAYIGESGDWCNECLGFNRDDCFKLRDEIRKKWINEITACMPSSQPHWIPCSDRLPKKDGLYLCWYKYYHWSKEKILPEYGIGYYDVKLKFWGGEVANGKDEKVLAWMPLPEPYEGE